MKTERPRTERRRLERKMRKQQGSNHVSPIPTARTSNRTFFTLAICFALAATTAVIASLGTPLKSSVPKPSTPPAVFFTAPNQGVVHLDDGGVVYVTDGKISAFHGEDPRHRQLIGLQYTAGSVDDTDYHPLLWRSVEMSLSKPDGSVAEVSAIRPLWWFETTKAKEGTTVPLDIHEAGISGMATVHKIASLSDKPYEPPTPGYNRVIGTIKHHNATLIQLFFEGAEDEPLGVTPNHPLWSEDRSDWVPSGELRIGEKVTTTESSARLLRSQQKPGKHTVYNIEVHRSHSFHVGKLGLMAHNTGLECERVFEVYHHLRTQKSKTPNQAFEYLQRRMPTVTSETMGKSLLEAAKDAGLNGNLWTKGKFTSNAEGSGINAYQHFLDHCVNNKAGFPGGEFPHITDAVSYVQEAHQFCSAFPSGADFVKWTLNGDEFFVQKSTRKVAIRVAAGTEVGALRTYHRKIPSKNLEQWARSNGFTGTF